MASTDQSQTQLSDAEKRTYTPREERRWNRMSEGMSYFHDMFKREFNTVYKLADGSFEKMGMSLPAYLKTARDFHDHLDFHHKFEEANVFPILAKRMPAFAGDANAEGAAHVQSHRAIHDGLEELLALTKKWSANPNSYFPDAMRACLEGFREVLFHHLDEEVDDLKGSNLKKYWTLEEVDRFIM